MPERIIAIGDIHGCAQALEAMLSRLQPGPDDIVVTLGDYIDRGADSREVIEQLIQLRDQTTLISLLGNHEVMLLTALEQPSELSFWLDNGGQATVSSYGDQPHDIPDEHIAFMRECRLYYETDEHFFVHANYLPTVSLDQQPQYTLLWEHLSRFVPAPHVSGKIAVVGHTPQLNGEILDLEYLVCIDTHCFGGGWLTAVDTRSGQYWQFDKQGQGRIQ